jgi:mono/diheme cytochrome c family protein
MTRPNRLLHLGMLLCSPAMAWADPPAARPISVGMKLLDATGGVHHLAPNADEAARVFVFLTGECPISASFVPTLNRFAHEWQRDSAKVAIYGVWADRAARPSAIKAFAQEFGVKFPLLIDEGGELCRAFGPTHVPEAFVLGGDGRVAYRGRIDDTFLAIGKRRPAATEHNLVDAVTALLQSKAVATPQTAPVGCLVEAATPPAARSKVTYTRDVAPILLANCVTCHREGGAGPFSLESYQDAEKRGRQLAKVAESRLMPPWLPGNSHGDFEGERRLTDRQIATIKSWVEAGKLEGNVADLPAPVTFGQSWPLGKPDLILEMPDTFTIPADGPDLFQSFVIPIDIPEDKLVAAADFMAGNPRVVHHSLFFLDTKGFARKLDARTPELGYGSFGGPGFIPAGSLGGWSPGKTPRRLPFGMGRYLKKGADLVMQVHYHPTGKRETDRSKVGIYFADQKKKVAADIWVAAHTHDIPAGDKAYRVSATYVLPSDVQMLGVVPHMHLLGQSVKAVAVQPDGLKRTLVEIPKWDFNWQDDYRYTAPFRLAKGTKIDVEALYDNSADNPTNPNSPPRRVTWGEGTSDEMLYCFFLVSCDNPADYRPLINDVLRREFLGQTTARARLLFKSDGTK